LQQPPPRTTIGPTNHDCHSGGEVVVFVAVVAVAVGVVVVFFCCCCCGIKTLYYSIFNFV
jgi:hypothetical protein